MINKSSVYFFMYVTSYYNGTNKFSLLFYVRLEDMHSSGSLPVIDSCQTNISLYSCKFYLLYPFGSREAQRSTP
ncbi:hypothetical protein HanRHA438_Chr05g0230891 [Helianthus annuus]|nr:hypothetical protein HanRHA438_Chr05g0230891 [Helianthus annuus]